MGRTPDAPWKLVLQRGPQDALPENELIEAFLQGDIRFELPGGATILRAAGEAGEVAFVLGETRCAERTLNILDGLLTLASLVEDDDEDDLEVWEPPLTSALPRERKLQVPLWDLPPTSG